MSSTTSSLASSTPATSLKVTLRPLSDMSLARLFPKESALLPPLCIWRIKKIHTPNKSSIGNQEMNKFTYQEVFRGLGLNPDTLFV